MKLDLRMIEMSKIAVPMAVVEESRRVVVDLIESGERDLHGEYPMHEEDQEMLDGYFVTESGKVYPLFPYESTYHLRELTVKDGKLIMSANKEQRKIHVNSCLVETIRVFNEANPKDRITFLDMFKDTEYEAALSDSFLDYYDAPKGEEK